MFLKTYFSLRITYTHIHIHMKAQIIYLGANWSDVKCYLLWTGEKKEAFGKHCTRCSGSVRTYADHLLSPCPFDSQRLKNYSWA